MSLMSIFTKTLPKIGPLEFDAKLEGIASKAISLTQLQPYTNGKITDEMLAATAKDLAEIK